MDPRRPSARGAGADERAHLEVILRRRLRRHRRVAALRPRVKATVEVGPAILLGWGFPGLRRFGPWRRTVDNPRELDRLIYREIHDRRSAADLPTAPTCSLA